jgi:lysophospholipase L1-like esterase
MTDPTDADAKNPGTILGALRLLIERLLAANPSVKIIVFAPFLRTDSNDVYPVNSEGMTMREFSDAICNVAKEYGLEHYNMCDYAGINTISIESLTNDGLHPNQKGGEKLGEIMARWIN